MRHSSYGTYRGKSKLRTFLTVLVIFLALVLILAVVGFFLLQPYLVHSTEGIRLNLPFLQQETPSPSPTLPQVIIVETPAPTATPAPELELVRAITLPSAAFGDGTAEGVLAAAGANAAIFNMKADTGDLGYVSTQPLAATAKVTATDPALNDAIAQYNKGAGYTVARVSCFKDHKTARADEALPIRSNSNYRWVDQNDLRWTSPAAPKARAYLSSLCKELAALGFDEIVLENASYPTAGRLGYIKRGAAYDEAQFATVVAGFYQEVKTALDGTGVKLGIVATEDALDGTDKTSGQTAENLAQYADHIWIAAPKKEGANYLTALKTAGMEQPAERIITLTTPGGAGADAKYSWAVLP